MTKKLNDQLSSGKSLIKFSLELLLGVGIVLNIGTYGARRIHYHEIEKISGKQEAIVQAQNDLNMRYNFIDYYSAGGIKLAAKYYLYLNPSN